MAYLSSVLPIERVVVWSRSTATVQQFRDDVATEGLPVDALTVLESPIRTRVLRLAAVAAGAPSGELFHQHVVAVDALLTDWHGQKWVDLPGHLRAVRPDGVLRFERVPEG